MKNQLIFLLGSTFMLNACSTTIDVNAQTITNEINAIENNLIQAIQLKSDEKRNLNLQERMAYHNVPGVSIAKVKGGKIHWVKSYGVQDANTKIEIDNNTIFQAASVTKPITALAVLKLMQEGKLDLDADVNSYLKRWKVSNNEFTQNEKVTVRRLLTHTAGLNIHGYDGYRQSEGFPSAIEVLNGEGNSRRAMVEETPGQRWRYSGAGYVILQLLIEDVSGQPFQQYMKNEILRPLGMNNSSYQQPLDASIQTNVSSAHDPRGEVIPGKWNNYPEMGPGGLWSTATDIAKYCMEIQKIYTERGEGILSKETIELMFTKHSERDWGLGPKIEGDEESLRFRHDGKNEGFIAEFVAFANNGEAVVVMTNGDRGNRIAREILLSISDYFKWDSDKPLVIDSKIMTANELESYTGTYDWQERPGYFIEVIIEQGQLVLLAPGYPEDSLTPINSNDFIDIETGLEVKFNKNENAVVTGLTWRGRFSFVKVE